MFFFENPDPSNSGIRFILNTPEVYAAFSANFVRFQIQKNYISLRLEGASSDVVLRAGKPLAGTLNLLLGPDRAKWVTQAPTYESILYQNLYPGVDLMYRTAGRHVKSEFTVLPHANPSQIRLVYPEALRVEIESNGDLLVTTKNGELRERAPEIYQDSEHGRVRIPGRFRLLGEHAAGFELGRYDRSRVLIIDPVVTYATYLGGSGMTSITGIATDPAGSVYVTGSTESLNLPIGGALQAANNGGVDVFVSKFAPDGASLLYSTYVGGTGQDSATAIAVDSLGQAYVTGFTTSTNFPQANPAQAGPRSSHSAFVFKLNSTGNQLVYSTYFGGSTWDSGTAIAVDAAGNAYVAGDTQSSNLPVLNAIQSMLGGQTDAFVAKFTPAGALSNCTYLGGSGIEHAGALAVDSNGNMYLGGGTFSTNFPVLNPIQAANGGGEDAFLSEISSTGNALLYSTYFGGNGTLPFPEEINAIAVDSSGSVYVAGITNSGNFPITAGALRTLYNGIQDAFVAKFSVGGALIYSTYLGGTESNLASSIAVDWSGNAYIGGTTTSVDFPVVNPVQASLGGLSDAFISQIAPGGNSLIFSTYYGGSLAEGVNALALDASGNIHFAGQTASSDFPLVAAVQSNYGGFATGFVASLTALLAAPVNPSPASGASGIGITPLLSWTESGATSFDVYFGTSASPGYLTTVSQPSFSAGTLLPGQTYYWRVVARNGIAAMSSATWSFTIAPVTCPYSLSATNASAAASAGNGTVNVITNSGCGWIAASNVSWMTITIGSSGSGPGPVGYSIAANTGNTMRTGTLSVAGITFTVSQAGSAVATPWKWIAAADFDRNGTVDAVWQDPTNGNSQVSYLDGSINVNSIGSATLTGSKNWRIVAVADFNRDGIPDLVWQDPVSGQSQVWFMSGATGTVMGTFVGLTGAKAWRIVAAADFNGDGVPDLLWQDPNSGASQIWYMGYTANPQAVTLQSFVSLTGAKAWRIVAVADFNGDGIPDLVWQDPKTGDSQVWYMGAQGAALMSFQTLTGAKNWRIVCAGDFNGDGVPDLVWQDPVSGTAQVWFMSYNRAINTVALQAFTNVRPVE